MFCVLKQEKYLIVLSGTVTKLQDKDSFLTTAPEHLNSRDKEKLPTLLSANFVDNKIESWSFQCAEQTQTSSVMTEACERSTVNCGKRFGHQCCCMLHLTKYRK